MTTVALGGHSKIIALRSEQLRIRRFFGEVLGCEFTKKTHDVDYLRFGKDFFMAVLYGDKVLEPEDLLKSIWLELKTDKPEELKKKILDFGVKELESWDKEHLYFQGPGGQVFRVVGIDEDLSRFEK
jgi:catechol 2,3-dioxygenase-like lactoylglutathione lyase family enzyme